MSQQAGQKRPPRAVGVKATPPPEKVHYIPTESSPVSGAPMSQDEMLRFMKPSVKTVKDADWWIAVLWRWACQDSDSLLVVTRRLDEQDKMIKRLTYGVAALSVALMLVVIGVLFGV